MSTEESPSEPLDPALRKLIWVLVLGALAPALDSTIVNVALATVGRAFHTSVATSQWTITGYLLAMGISMPVTGWATVRFGAKRMWLFSLSLFLAGSVLSGAAWNVTGLIVFRVIQGVGAGLMLPIVTTMLVQAAGSKRLGRIMAVASLPVVVVPILGPVVGGLIVGHLSWRWIFYVNVPICLTALVLAWRLVPADLPTQVRHRFDLLGLLWLSPGLALLIFGFSQAGGQDGFASQAAMIPLLVGLALLAAFTAHVLQKDDGPLINLRLLRIRPYAAAIGVLFVACLSVYGPLLLLALYYQEIQEKSVLVTGLLLAPQGLGSLLPRAVVGKLTDRIGPRPIVITGLLVTMLGTLAFTRAGPNSDGWLLGVSLFVRGAGLAAVTIAVMAGAFQRIPAAEVPDASSTTRICNRSAGGSFGVAVLTLILTHQLLVHVATTAASRASSFDTTFWWATAFGLLALIPALFLSGKPAADADDARNPMPLHPA